MQTKIKNPIAIALLAFALFACNNANTNNANTNNPNNANKPQNATQTQAQPTTTTDTIRPNITELKGDFCFLEALNKDTTTVSIRILSSDDIRGEMIWNPWQKDGAIGTLTGKTNANNELILDYQYTIEGNRQSETKIMKIENGKLYIKKGELIDPKNDGNLSYKDENKAQYTEILNPIKCP